MLGALFPAGCGEDSDDNAPRPTYEEAKTVALEKPPYDNCAELEDRTLEAPAGDELPELRMGRRLVCDRQIVFAYWQLESESDAERLVSLGSLDERRPGSRPYFINGPVLIVFAPDPTVSEPLAPRIRNACGCGEVRRPR